MNRRIHGIFCLETDWWNDFNRSSTVKPVLKLLAQGVQHQVPFVHRDIGTREEFEHYCRKWSQKTSARYPVLYLAFHGEPGCILVGDQRRARHRVCLDELAEILGPRLSGRMVHFGSCDTLGADREQIDRFLRKTGLVAVAGFKRNVDWLYSAVFEVLLLETMMRYPLTLPGMRQARYDIETQHAAMCASLQFRFVVRGNARVPREALQRAT